MRQTEKLLSIIIKVRSANCTEKSKGGYLKWVCMVYIDYSSCNGKCHIVFALKQGRMIFYKHKKEEKNIQKCERKEGNKIEAEVISICC